MEDDKREPLKVHLVNPPSENPWRTQGDYLEDQRRAKIQFRIAIATMVVSLLGVVATAIVAIESLQRMSATYAATTQDQLPKSKAFDRKLAAKAENDLKRHIENLKTGKSGVIRWGAIRKLSYELKPGDSEDTLMASLDYEEDFSYDSRYPFARYSQRELEVIYFQNKWWLMGGRHRLLVPAGQENSFPDWTPIAEGSVGFAMNLKMGVWGK